jgi:hypothetical protein
MGETHDFYSEEEKKFFYESVTHIRMTLTPHFHKDEQDFSSFIFKECVSNNKKLYSLRKISF